MLRFGSASSTRVSVVVDRVANGDVDLYVDADRNLRIDDRDLAAAGPGGDGAGRGSGEFRWGSRSSKARLSGLFHATSSFVSVPAGRRWHLPHRGISREPPYSETRIADEGFLREGWMGTGMGFCPTRRTGCFLISTMMESLIGARAIPVCDDLECRGQTLRREVRRAGDETLARDNGGNRKNPAETGRQRGEAWRQSRRDARDRDREGWVGVCPRWK